MRQSSSKFPLVPPARGGDLYRYSLPLYGGGLGWGCLVFILVVFVSEVYALPSFQEVRGAHQVSDAVLLDRNGKVLHELRVDPKARRLEWTELKDISPALVKAVICSEDKRFYSHYGVDWLAAGSALIKKVFGKTSRGASTITMQTVSFLDDKLSPGANRRSFGQKWKQTRAALELEKFWSKEEILEAYLNLVTYRGELQGISAASRGLFDKGPAGLNETESAILAALIRAPNAPADKTIKRACLLNASLGLPQQCSEIASAAAKVLNNKYHVRQRETLAPHMAHMLLDNSSERLINSKEKAVSTTLDYDVQRFAVEALRQHLAELKTQNVHDGAVLVVENKSGDILAYIGSIGAGSDAPEVDGVRARRQAGSTLKPFLYATALEKKLLTAASVISDSPADMPAATGIYKPRNYENDFKGMVSLRMALGSSLNVPAVRTLSVVGVENFVQKLKAFGFGSLRNDDYYGYSLALGSADVTLYELVNAYRTLANDGVYSAIKFKPGNVPALPAQAISPEAAFIVSDILADRDARSYTFSLENPLSTKFRSSVKTGTSKDMRDNWCIGYSDKYTVGVWTGNFSGEAMWNVTGITGAAPVWLAVMSYVNKSSADMAKTPPEGIVKRVISFEKTIEPAREELFISGTEPAAFQNNRLLVSVPPDYGIPRIVYPPDGAIIALDPDIPSENQVLVFEADPATTDFAWVLNGEKINRNAEAPVITAPRSGKHKLLLVDKQNNVLDSVEFEVRGIESPSP